MHLIPLWLTSLCLLLFLNPTSGMTIQVQCEPPLPRPNLLTNNPDFESGLQHWNNKHSAHTVEKDPDQPKNHALYLKRSKQSVWQSIPTTIVVPGKAYIASCRIRPDLLVSTARSSFSGLGFSLTFWDRDWKQACNIQAFGSGACTWQPLIGEPQKLPPWITHAQLHVSLSYTSGSGYIDDLCLQEAYTTMKINIKAEVAIRQIKIMDMLGNTHFDTGILTGKQLSFTQDLQVKTPLIYTIMAITDNGDVESVIYP